MPKEGIEGGGRDGWMMNGWWMGDEWMMDGWWMHWWWMDGWKDAGQIDDEWIDWEVISCLNKCFKRQEVDTYLWNRKHFWNQHILNVTSVARWNHNRVASDSSIAVGSAMCQSVCGHQYQLMNGKKNGRESRIGQITKKTGIQFLCRCESQEGEWQGSGK